MLGYSLYTRAFRSAINKATSYITQLYRFIDTRYRDRTQLLGCGVVWAEHSTDSATWTNISTTVSGSDAPRLRELLHKSRREWTVKWKTSHRAMRDAGIKIAAGFSGENGL